MANVANATNEADARDCAAVEAKTKPDRIETTSETSLGGAGATTTVASGSGVHGGESPGVATDTAFVDLTGLPAIGAMHLRKRHV